MGAFTIANTSILQEVIVRVIEASFQFIIYCLDA